MELGLTVKGYGREYLEYLSDTELKELYQKEFNNNRLKNRHYYDDTYTKQHNVREQETGYQMHG